LEIEKEREDESFALRIEKSMNRDAVVDSESLPFQWELEEPDGADEIRDSSESGRKGYAIRERAFELACAVSEKCEELASQSFTGREIARQLFRSASSIGANLEEADAAHSRADFTAKCEIALKEARETRYWLRLAQRTKPVVVDDLLSEVREIVAILTTIIKKTRDNAK